MTFSKYGNKIDHRQNSKYESQGRKDYDVFLSLMTHIHTFFGMSFVAVFQQPSLQTVCI